MKNVRVLYFICSISFYSALFSAQFNNDISPQLASEISNDVKKILPLKDTDRIAYNNAEKVLFEKYKAQNKTYEFIVIKSNIISEAHQQRSLMHQVPLRSSSRSASVVSNVSSEHLVNNNDLKDYLLSPGVAFDDVKKQEEMVLLRQKGSGNIYGYQNQQVNWLTITFPIFAHSDLLQIYTLLYGLVNNDDTLPALVDTLNNYTMKSLSYKGLSPRTFFNILIGKRAADEVDNYVGMDQKKIQLLEKYFLYTLGKQVGESAPFSQEEITRFRDEARALEHSPFSYSGMIKNTAKVNATVIGLAGITTAAIISNRAELSPLFNAARTVVTNTLANVTHFLNMINRAIDTINSPYRSAVDYFARPF